MTVAVKTRIKPLDAPLSVVGTTERPPFLEFFAGSGLVSHALSPYFELKWANDIAPDKASVFQANHRKASFQLDSIDNIDGSQLPEAFLSWGSFPCQDLSVAGKVEGIRARRSGLVWSWLRVMDSMRVRPSIVVAENVVGLLSSNSGSNYRELHSSLVSRGYRIGAMILDAERWVPQSRPRVFIVAVSVDMAIPPGLLDAEPNWLHNPTIVKLAAQLDNWLWWKMPEPPRRQKTLSDLIEWDAPCFDKDTSKRTLALIPESHFKRFENSRLNVAPGYKRIRNQKQVLELRFDNVAGCLRTPAGGSSRQFLVLKKGNEWASRLLTVREAARLMGAPDTYQLPGSYNDGYRAMGDAVAVPVAAYLAKHLLAKLAASYVGT